MNFPRTHTLFFLFLFVGLMDSSAVQAITLDPRGFFTPEEPACLSAAEVKRHLNDYDIDAEDFPQTAPDDCDTPYWQLLQTINLITRLATGDINGPSDRIKSLPSRIPRSLRKIRFRAAPAADGTLAELDYTEQTLTITPAFFKVGPLLRMTFLIHAARHFEGHHYLHQLCTSGPLKGRRSCDEVYVPNGTTANIGAIQILAWLHTQANPARVSPVLSEYARHLANSILSLGFVEPPDYWLH